VASQKKNVRLWLMVFSSVVLLAAAIGFGILFFEGEDPSVAVDLPAPYIGSAAELPVTAADAGRGLRKVWVALTQDGRETVLHEENFAAEGLLRQGKVRTISLKVPVDPAALGFSEGEALLRIKVWDYSWRGWWKGNAAYVEQPLVIDTRPPQVTVLTRAHNINQGGSGVVVYRLSETCPEHGVLVGDLLYPGRSGYFEDASVQLAFIALADTQESDTKLSIKAVDRAGNTAQAGFYHHIRRKQFRQDVIPVSDSFLNAKMPEFAASSASAGGASNLDRFLTVNRDLRRENYRTIASLTGSSQTEMLWEGDFLRLPKAAPKAGFADRRTYTYDGKEIDQQTHLGIDLASLANSPVPAANAGLVVFAGDLGIYGGTVIVDHGFGLFSMYSHLSQIAVIEADRIAKGALLGRTGQTGLAGGDHLHFAMLVNSTFVNPIEWWDAKWIKDNVTDKLEDVRQQLAQGKKG